MVDHATGWFEIFEFLCFDLNEVARGNSEYIEKLSAGISQLFNQTWLCSQPRTHEVVFENGSEFNQDFPPLLKDFSITPICTSIENTQSNAPVKRIHQMIYKKTTKDIDIKVYD